MPSFLGRLLEPTTAKKLAILEAAREGSLERARALLVEDSRLARITDNKGKTALHLAAFNGSRAVVEVLLGANADINASQRYLKF